MSTADQPARTDRSGGIDPAALAAATLAAAISSIAPAGPYNAVGMMFGVTVLLLILAYDVDPHRTGWQSLAFAAVCALILLLAVGYLLEIYWTANPAWRIATLFKEPASDNPFSEIPPYIVLLVWAVSAAGFFVIDLYRSRHKPRHNLVDSRGELSGPCRISVTPWI